MVYAYTYMAWNQSSTIQHFNNSTKGCFQKSFLIFATDFERVGLYCRKLEWESQQVKEEVGKLFGISQISLYLCSVIKRNHRDLRFIQKLVFSFSYCYLIIGWLFRTHWTRRDAGPMWFIWAVLVILFSLSISSILRTRPWTMCTWSTASRCLGWRCHRCWWNSWPSAFQLASLW